jgi:lysozyme family protein
MAKSTYARVMPEVFAHEGGWSDHPSDPGGATNMGITIGVFSEWLGRPATKTELRNMPKSTAEAIYKARYADPLRYDDLPAGVDYATLDGGINSGVSRGAKWLQRAVGAAQDGKVGPLTVNAANAAPDKVATVKRICGYRLGFVQSLRTWSVFGRGWARRIAEVEALGVTLALEARNEAPRGRIEVEQIDAEASANRAGNTAVATGAPSTIGGGTAAVDPAVVDQASSLPGLALFVLGVIVAGYFVFRWHVNRQRAAAYAAQKELV